MCKQKNVGPLPDTFRLTIRQEVVRGEGGVGGGAGVEGVYATGGSRGLAWPILRTAS